MGIVSSLNLERGRRTAWSGRRLIRLRAPSLIQLLALSLILLHPPAAFGKPATTGASYKGWVVRAVRIEGIEPGVCQICFPNLDAAAWERI